MSRLLDTEALAKLAGLQLRVKAAVEGTLAGLHRSPHHGSSVEFAEHKEYSPGDDLRHLDWKAYGKFDRYYIKRFEDETELKAYLMLDCSGSMGYGGAERQAAYLAHGLATLGWEVHFALFDGGENLPLLESSGARVHRLAPRGNYDPRRFAELLGITRRVAPDLVQTWLNMASAPACSTALRSSSIGKPPASSPA